MEISTDVMPPLRLSRRHCNVSPSLASPPLASSRYPLLQEHSHSPLPLSLVELPRQTISTSVITEHLGNPLLYISFSLKGSPPPTIPQKLLAASLPLPLSLCPSVFLSLSLSLSLFLSTPLHSSGRAFIRARARPRGCYLLEYPSMLWLSILARNVVASPAPRRPPARSRHSALCDAISRFLSA